MIFIELNYGRTDTQSEAIESGPVIVCDVAILTWGNHLKLEDHVKDVYWDTFLFDGSFPFEDLFYSDICIVSDDNADVYADRKLIEISLLGEQGRWKNTPSYILDKKRIFYLDSRLPAEGGMYHIGNNYVLTSKGTRHKITGIKNVD